MSSATETQVFGRENNVSIDRAWGHWHAAATDVACHDGAAPRKLVTIGSLVTNAWAATMSRPAANKAWPASRGRVPQSHPKKPPCRLMLRHVARGHAGKSTVPAHFADIFARQKARVMLRRRKVGVCGDGGRRSAWPISPTTSSIWHAARPEHSPTSVTQDRAWPPFDATARRVLELLGGLERKPRQLTMNGYLIELQRLTWAVDCCHGGPC